MQKAAFKAGLGIVEFWDSTLAEVLLYIGAYQDRAKDESDRAWGIARWVSTIMINIQLSQNDRIKPTDLFEFDWEKGKKLKRSKKDSRKTLKVWDKLIKQKHAKGSGS